MVQQLVSIILSKLKWMVEILVSQSPEDCSREIFTGFHISLLIRSETCLFLSKGMRLRFQKYTQMCLFWNSVAAPDTLYVPSLYYSFSYRWTSTKYFCIGIFCVVERSIERDEVVAMSHRSELGPRSRIYDDHLFYDIKMNWKFHPPTVVKMIMADLLWDMIPKWFSFYTQIIMGKQLLCSTDAIFIPDIPWVDIRGS